MPLNCSRRLLEVAGVQLRDGVVVVLLGGEERQAGFLHLPLAGGMYIRQRSTISMARVGSSFSKAASAFSYLPCCSS